MSKSSINDFKDSDIVLVNSNFKVATYAVLVGLGGLAFVGGCLYLVSLLMK